MWIENSFDIKVGKISKHYEQQGIIHLAEKIIFNEKPKLKSSPFS